MKRNTFVHIEVVRQGNIEGRDQFTLADFRLILQAIGVVCVDHTGLGHKLRKPCLKLLKKLNEVAK